MWQRFKQALEDAFARFTRMFGSKSATLKDEILIVKKPDRTGPWDMKPVLLASPSAKVSKDGSRYMAIPMGSQMGVEFRTVSDKSPEGSWIHPGYGPKDVEKSIDAEIEKIDNDLTQALKEDLLMLLEDSPGVEINGIS